MGLGTVTKSDGKISLIAAGGKISAKEPSDKIFMFDPTEGWTQLGFTDWKLASDQNQKPIVIGYNEQYNGN